MGYARPSENNPRITREHIESMSDDSHFNCQNCGLPYLVTQEPSSEQHSGAIECVDCKKVAHEWTGYYNMSDWRPLRMTDPKLHR